MSAIAFRTLGTLDLRAADGRELHSLLAQPKRVALLAYLCIAEPRGYHRRDTLLGLFWPDSDQEHARTSLRKSIHVLRRALGEDAIASRGDEEIEVDRSRISCDVESFEELLRTNRLSEALAIYRGDLLTGFFVEEAPEFEKWLDAQRKRLRSAAAHAAYEVARELEKEADVAGAIAFARRSLDLSETDERSLCKLIELQVRAGDRAAAIGTYESFARMLTTEYHTVPSEATRLLIDSIRSGAAEKVTTAQGESARDQGVPASGFPPAIESQPRASRRFSARTLLVGALPAVLIMSAFAWGMMRSADAKQIVRYTLAIDSSEEMVPGASYWSRLAISPDSKRLAYIGGPNGELLIRRRDQLRATIVRNTKGAESPFFSPDGRQIGYLGEQRVYIVGGNGEIVTVCDSLNGVAGASWGKDGFIYVNGQYYVSLVRVRARARARPEWFTELDTTVGEIGHSWPDVLPNGKGVLFTITSKVKGTADSLSYSIGVAEIPSGKHRVILNDAVYARYAASGHVLYVTTKKTLMVVPFDQNSMAITGDPTILVEGMRVGRFGSADVAVSQTGTLVYATGGGAGKQELVWVTRDGKPTPIDPDWTGDFWAPVLSPDGRHVAVERRLDGPRQDIWVKQLDRGPSGTLTRERDISAFPTWTPDGKSVTFLSAKHDTLAYLTRRADGSAPSFVQVPGKVKSYALNSTSWRKYVTAVWSPDGRWFIYTTGGAGADTADIVGIRPGIDTTPVPIIVTTATEAAPAISPDGRWLAYSSNETGQFEVYVVPFPKTRSARWVISAHGGYDAQWSPRGNELFYRDEGGNFVAVEVKTEPVFRVLRTSVLFSTGRLFMGRAKRYAVSPDASRFLMIQPANAGPEKLVVVENWFEELKAKQN